MTKVYKISNSFHATATYTRYNEQERYEIDNRIAAGNATDAERQARRRAHNTLCGSPTCTCSDAWGVRR